MWNVSIRVRPFNRREIAIHEKELEKSGFPASRLVLKPVVNMRPSSHHDDSSREKENGGIVEILEHTDEKGFQLPVGRVREAFLFDNIFWSIPMSHCFNCSLDYATQQDVFDRIGGPAVDTLFSGRNVVIYSHGQTGSGKATTIIACVHNKIRDGIFKDSVDEVGDENKGLLPKVLEEIFDRIEKKDTVDPGVQFRVELRAVELYNEKLRDMISKKPSSSDFLTADLQKSRKSKNPNAEVTEDDDDDFLDNFLFKRIVHSSAHAKSVFHHFMKYRSFSDVRMGQFHSRSFGIFEIILTQIDAFKSKVTQSKMQLVDGAGTEKIRGGFYPGGAVLEEAKNIGRSLTNFRKCIDVLTDNQIMKRSRKNPPVHESLLTTVLKDMFFGKAKVFLIGTLSPHEICIEDSLNTLRYMLRAKSLSDAVVYFKKSTKDDVVANDDDQKKAGKEKDDGKKSEGELIVRTEVPIAKQWNLEEFFAFEKKKEDLKRSKIKQEELREIEEEELRAMAEVCV